jgi:hypothetical protein
MVKLSANAEEGMLINQHQIFILLYICDKN